MAKESDCFAMNLAISIITGLFTIGAEVTVAYLVPHVQNPIVVNNNVVISADDYEKRRSGFYKSKKSLKNRSL